MQDQQHFFANLARAKRLIEARPNNSADVRQVEQEIASEMLGKQHDIGLVGPNGPSEFEAAEFVGDALQGAIAGFAIESGIKPPKQGTYSPLFATVAMFRTVWRLRQTIDQLGIPYDFYMPAALEYWRSAGKKRIPRPSQLADPDVITHVMRAWMDRIASAD